MSRAIVIFARSPEWEAASKRLPVDRAAPLFRSVLAAWLHAAVRANATAVIACSSDSRPRMESIAAGVPRMYVDQNGRTFGERLATSAAAVFDLGFQSVLITGIDVAPSVDLERAFHSLEAGRDVIAPARDGGINLIGLRAPAGELLATFSTRDGRLAERCREYFTSLDELPPACDLDSAADIRSARKDRAWRDYHELLSACLPSPGPEWQPLRHSLTLASSSPTRAPPLD
jgi:glycosyltransferase A (GT-A) superfamily protein (DUF2064 family)